MAKGTWEYVNFQIEFRLWWGHGSIACIEFMNPYVPALRAKKESAYSERLC